MDLTAQPGEHLFVENRGGAARQSFVGDETHGIRSDVDDGNWRPKIEAALCDA
jgi:hypothetical protein